MRRGFFDIILSTDLYRVLQEKRAGAHVQDAHGVQVLHAGRNVHEAQQPGFLHSTLLLSSRMHAAPELWSLTLK